jgi:uncharacterized protein
MRRKEKEIKDQGEIEEILKTGMFCRVGLSDDGMPYVVPVCYGYEKGVLYFHCAKEGRKIDIIRKNNNVCVEITGETEIIKKEAACNWGLRYKSVIGFGRATILEDEAQKREGLTLIMRQYGGSGHEFNSDSIRKTVLVKVVLENITGKKADH